MKITPITSTANPLLKSIRGLRRRAAREKSGLFLIEGSKLIAEAMRLRVTVKEIVVSQTFLQSGLGAAHDADIKALAVVDDREFAELSTMDTPEGIIAVAEMPHSRSERVFAGESPLVVIADAIQDPGNLGTIMRTALAASVSGMIFARGTVDPFNPKVVRAASGALFSLPFIQDMPVADAITVCRANGLKVVVADSAGGEPFWSTDLSGPTALLFGNEGQGVDASVLAFADARVTIPMSAGCESLNVSVSAGIIMFGAVQQRQSARAR